MPIPTCAKPVLTEEKPIPERKMKMLFQEMTARERAKLVQIHEKLIPEREMMVLV